MDELIDGKRTDINEYTDATDGWIENNNHSNMINYIEYI